jgi:clan AA aspartic protease (TIGR02281 family)
MDKKLIWITCLLFSFPQFVHADTIIFKNKQKIDGVIKKETADTVMVDVGAGVFTFALDEIEMIEKSDVSEKIKNTPAPKMISMDQYSHLATLYNKVRLKRDIVSRLNHKRMLAEKQFLKIERELVPHYKEFESLNNEASSIDWGGQGTVKERKESFAIRNRYNTLVSLIKEQETQLNQFQREMNDVGAELSRSMSELSELIQTLESAHTALLKQDVTGEYLSKYGYIQKLIDRYNSDWVRADIPLIKEGTNYSVNVKVNDKAFFPFLIDTGASTVVISREMAETLHLRKEDEIKTIECRIADGSVVPGRLVMLDAMEVGTMRIEQVPAIIMDDSVKGMKVQSLLGMTFLQHFYFQLDTKGNTLVLKKFEG